MNIKKPVIFTFSKDGLNIQNDYNIVYEDPKIIFPYSIENGNDDGDSYFKTNGTAEKMKAIMDQIQKNGKVQVGSQEGNNRSHATYNSIVLQRNDGTQTDLFDKGYQPNGNKFETETAIDLDAGDKIIADITLPKTTDNKEENVIAFGTDISQWSVYNSPNDYAFQLYWNGTHIKTHYLGGGYYPDYSYNDCGTHVKVVFSKDDLTIQNLNGTEAGVNKTLYVPCKVDYDATKSGDIKLKRNSEVTWKELPAGASYYVVADDGKAFVKKVNENMTFTEYVENTGNQTFIASHIVKSSNIKGNEGEFMSFADKDEVGKNLDSDLGVYVDRAIKAEKQTEAQWNLTSTDDAMGNCKLSLVMPYDITNGEPIDQAATYYLCATSDYVKGYQGHYTEPKDPTKFWYDSDPDHQGFTSDYSTARLVSATDSRANTDNATWRIIPLANYVDMLNNKTENLDQLLDITYVVKDDGFYRENGELSAWKTEGDFAADNSDSKEDKLRIGLDGIYKTSTTSTKYDRNSQEAELNARGRYMGVQVCDGGHGEFYQDVKVYRRGWYVLEVQGKSNVGAKLFMQRGDETNTRVAVDMQQLADGEYQRLYHDGNAQWPCADWSPMYNAFVEMNDEHLKVGRRLEYKNVVKCYIGQDVSYDNPMTLRIGISIPESTKSDDHTFFDSFRMLYGGKSDPTLVLNEDSTNLNYIDNCIHNYGDAKDPKTLFLKRTFTPGNWSTLMLPVNLSKRQFTDMFGADALLAYLKEIKNDVVRFYTVDDNDNNGVFLKAYMPYIIRTNKAKGSTPGFTQELTLREVDSQGQTQTLNQVVPDDCFVVDGVTLVDHQNVQDHYYDFAGGKFAQDNQSKDYSKKAPKFAYSVVADNEGNGAATNAKDNYTLTSYATLCKTYYIDANGPHFYESRPNLNDGKSYYFSQNNMVHHTPDAHGYGLKGFRCWFVYDQTDGGQTMPAQLKVSIKGVDESTDIDDIDTDGGQPVVRRYTGAIYNLNGQVVSHDIQALGNLPAGLYIVNGKKYVVNK